MGRIRDDRGFSLIELIVVIAILAILTGSSISVLNYVSFGNVKNCANRLNAYIGEVRTDTMTKEFAAKSTTKEGRPYLYFFKDSDGIYALVSDNVLSDPTTEKSNAEKIGNANISVKAYENTNTGEVQRKNLDTTGDFIKIGFKKNTGGFSSSTDFYNRIEVGNSSNHYNINMVKETGRYYIGK